MAPRVTRSLIAIAVGAAAAVTLAGCGDGTSDAPARTAVARQARTLFTAPLRVTNRLAVPVSVAVTSPNLEFWWDSDGAVPTAGPPAGLNGATVAAGAQTTTQVAYDIRCAFDRVPGKPWVGCGGERAWFKVSVSAPGSPQPGASFELNLKDTESPRSGPRWGPRRLPQRSSAGCDRNSLGLFDQRFTYDTPNGAHATALATVHCFTLNENEEGRGRITTITVAPE